MNEKINSCKQFYAILNAKKEMKQKKSLKQKKRFPFQALDQRQRRSKIEWIVFLMELRIVDRSDFVSLAVQMINI